MIQVNNIDVSYGPVQALHHVSVEISQDQAVAIIGSNGAGKTTLMKSIVGLCKPSNGAILFDGEPIHTLATHEIIRKGIVLVPEGRKIFPKLTVRSNLEMGAYTRKGAIEHSIEEIFTYFPRLKERMNQLAGTLSGGEQQMLAIGRGLMAEPKLLMLDEPSMGLAPVIVEEMFTIINRIHKERRLPILLVEQNAYMALETCDYALKVVGKNRETVKVVISGAGAAAVSIARLLLSAGFRNITMCDRKGAIYAGREDLNWIKEELAELTNTEKIKGSLADLLVGADVFIGVSAPGLVTKEMVRTMNKDAIIFACANPTPEIFPEEAIAGGACIVATGRSDYPNQINNVLAFPGIFRGAFDVRASDINEEMKLAAAQALAGLISEDELSTDYIIPKAFDPRVGPAVARAVADAARCSGVARV